MNKGSDENGVPYKNALDVIVRQCKRGLGGFYAGVQVIRRVAVSIHSALMPWSLRSKYYRTSSVAWHSFTYSAHSSVCTAGRLGTFAAILLPNAHRRKSANPARRRFGKISMAANMLLGYIAATVNLTITMPVEVRAAATPSLARRAERSSDSARCIAKHGFLHPNRNRPSPHERSASQRGGTPRRDAAPGAPPCRSHPLQPLPPRLPYNHICAHDAPPPPPPPSQVAST